MVYPSLSAPLRRHRGSRGFSLLELLLVAALCGAVFTSGALAFRAIALNQRRATTFQTVTLTAQTAENFFPGAESAEVDSYTAPNYGRSVLAEQLKGQFLEDVEKSVAVFPLARAGNINTVRPKLLNIGEGWQVSGKPTPPLPSQIDTPEAFRQLLLSLKATTTGAAVFTGYRGYPSGAANGSIYVLDRSNAVAQLSIRCVYEIDHVGFTDSATSTACVYSSVRRYYDGKITGFYDVVTREATVGEAGIPFAHFEKSSRAGFTETGVIPAPVAEFKIAPSAPFYLVWWPDPGMPRLGGTALAGTFTTLPKKAYWHHRAQTSLSLVVPQFPPL